MPAADFVNVFAVWQSPEAFRAALQPAKIKPLVATVFTKVGAGQATIQAVPGEQKLDEAGKQVVGGG